METSKLYILLQIFIFIHIFFSIVLINMWEFFLSLLLFCKECYYISADFIVSQSLVFSDA